MNSALYIGSVIHRRLRPKRHRLRYRVFWMLIDLDEIDALTRKLRSGGVMRGVIVTGSALEPEALVVPAQGEGNLDRTEPGRSRTGRGGNAGCPDG